MSSTYLDHAATTPVDPRVLDAMLPYFTDRFGNPSSVHGHGRQVRFVLEECRERAAAFLGAMSSEIIFTGGGTESDNTALSCGFDPARPGIVISAMEHDAVRKFALASGRPVHTLQVDRNGKADLVSIGEATLARSCIASVMAVNNEVGCVNDIPALAEQARSNGLIFHTDAVQAFGVTPVDVLEWGIDLLSLSAHKIYGPKGVGLLFVRNGIDHKCQLFGGGQERKRRAGTENLAGIVGLVKAMELVEEEREERVQNYLSLRSQLLTRLAKLARETNVAVNSPDDGAPHIVNFSVPGRDAEMLLLNLDHAGYSVSGGSACSSGSVEPSHVLVALGKSPAAASTAVRVSFGKDTTASDIDNFVDALSEILNQMSVDESGVFAT